MAALGSILGTLFGGLASIYGAKKQARAMESATAQARDAALQQEQRAIKTEKAGEAEMNRANRRQPNAGALLSSAQQSARSGASGTMLTGPSGINPDDLRLGRSTLLGS
jgi:phage repressor protein C with HTH and peptisase S24 domain